MRIALHRQGPDVLPASRFLFLALLVVYLLASLLSLRSIGQLNSRFVVYLVVDCALLLGCVLALLQVFRRKRRFLQTMTALLGVDVLLTVFAISLTVVARVALGSLTAETVTLIVDVMRLVVLIWWIDVAAYVLSRAVDRAYIVGLGFVILYWLFSLRIGASLIPPAS